MIAIIYGSARWDILPSDSSYRSRQIMGENALHLSFDYEGYLDIPVGAYCDYEGERYYLLKPQNFVKNGIRKFSYTLTMQSEAGRLSLYKLTDTSGRVKFPMTAKPVDFLTLIALKMNEKSTGWSVGTFPDKDPVLVSFEGVSIAEALSMVASAFDTEWHVDGKVISLGKIKKNADSPLALSYGKGNGFIPGLGRANYDNSMSFERLYVQGGERNIDYSKYGSRNLHLPEGAILAYNGTAFHDNAEQGDKTYATDSEGKYITRYGYSIAFHPEDVFSSDEAYPKRMGTVTDWIAVNPNKEFYDLVDSTIPADLDYKACRIAGESWTIVFQTGMLAGKEFDIHDYIHEERRFELVPVEIDGILMPNETWKPAFGEDGDKYAVFGCQLPDAYINAYSEQSPVKEGAEWDLFKEAIKYMWENQEPRFTFTGPLDEKWVDSNWERLYLYDKFVLGGMILFTDTQFAVMGETIRIIGIKDYINTPHKLEIELSNATVKSSVATELNEYKGEEVLREKRYQDSLQFTKRTFKQAQELLAMLEGAFAEFSEGITPISVQTMATLIGTESNQFKVYDNSFEAELLDFPLSLVDGFWQVAACGLRHYTIGVNNAEITTQNRSDATIHYKQWTFPLSDFKHEVEDEGEEGEEEEEPTYVDVDVDGNPLEDDMAYYLYAKVPTLEENIAEGSTPPSGTFYFSKAPVLYDAEEGYYNFLVGVLSSKDGEGTRGFAPLYGYTEILPNRIRTGAVVSENGKTSLNLTSGVLSLNANTSVEGEGAGLSGAPVLPGDEDYNKNIAFWLGGPRVDYEALTPAQRSTMAYAQALLRFDGTGYFAGGKLRIYMENGEAKLEINGGDIGGASVSSVGAIANMFKRVNIGTTANPQWAIKVNEANYVGLFTDGFLTAGGSNPGTGGGGSTVTWSQVVTSGTKIATITIDGTSTDVYAPTGGSGGSTVAWSAASSSDLPEVGGRIGLTVDNTKHLLSLYGHTHEIYEIFPGVGASSGVQDGQTVIWDGTNSRWKFAQAGGGYTLPIASTSALGGIKVGTNLSINESTGVLSAQDTTYSAGTVEQLTVGTDTNVKVWSASVLASWLSDNYLKYFGFVSGTNPDANNLLFGSYAFGDSLANRPQRNNGSYSNGALVAFGQHGDYGPAQIAVDDNGALHSRILWYDGTWRGWNKVVHCELTQTITGQKTFSQRILSNGISIPTGYGGIVVSQDGTTYRPLEITGWTVDDKWSFQLAPNYDSDAITGSSFLGTRTKPWSFIYGSSIYVTGQSDNSGKIMRFGTDGQLVSSGISYDDVVTISGAQTITGQKTFSSSILANSTSVEIGSSRKPWGKIYIGGNKGIYLSDGNGGEKALFISNGYDDDGQGNAATVLFGYGTKASHNFNYYARAHTFYIYDSTASSNERVGFQVTSYGNISRQVLRPHENGSIDLGASGYLWNDLFAKTWRPTTSTATGYPKMTYNSSEARWEITGNLIVTGYVTAGGVNSDGNTTLRGNLIPATTGLNIGSENMKLGCLYTEYIGDSGDGLVNTIYANNVGSNITPVSNLYATNAKLTGTLTVNNFTTTSTQSTITNALGLDTGNSTTGVTIAGLTNVLTDVSAGKIYRWVIGSYNLLFTGAKKTSTSGVSSGDELYAGRYCFRLTNASSNTWTIFCL